MNLSLLMPISQALSVVPAGQVAMVDKSDAELFAAMARLAEWRMDEVKEKSFANAEWAFAIVDQPDAELFLALARMAR